MNHIAILKKIGKNMLAIPISTMSYFFGYRKSSKDSPSEIIKKTTYGYSSLYNYYKYEYLTDLDVFKKACPSYNHADVPENQLFFVQDLTFLKKNDHILLKKKHFMYFMVVNTALLMAFHKYQESKYEEFEKRNNGIVFEFGLTNTFIYPWEILRRLNVPFDKELFMTCLGMSIGRLMTDDYFCGIIPNDFIYKFMDDPDLNKNDTIYGKEWKSMCLEEWFNHTSCICPKNPTIL
jgi:hypothetical protein